MRDWLAVQVAGDISIPRARALWQDGIMRLYTKKGFVAEIPTSNPKRVKGFIRRWEAVTDKGTITLNGKCIACGGWWRVAKPKAIELWKSADAQQSTPTN